MLTHERLTELLNYDEDTGIFTRKTKVASRLAGSVAGAKHNKGYVQIMIDCENYLAHRLAWFYVYGKWPKKQIDHINRIKTDNRIKNLRDVDNSKNQHNIGIRSHNSSGVTGVYQSSKSKRWIATIELNNKKYCLGTYESLDDAKSARQDFEKKLA